MNYKHRILKACSFLLFTVFLVTSSVLAFAQEKSITGKIVDNEGQPLPGVAVIVKGSSRGSVSDFTGNYTIADVKSTDALIFSFVGLMSQEILVGEKVSIDVVLEPDAIGLEEVVAIGYGTAKKQTLTGAIEQVKSEVFEKSPSSNPVLALQGQTPGLTITRTSSRPGAEDLNLKIRGTNSINSESPLIIIDGVSTLGNSAFTSLNPDDIESMSILKDASAAIYGARAANGVILVTTKKGNGDVKVNLSTQFNINTTSMRPPVAENPKEYAEVWLNYGAQDADAGITPYYWAWTEDQLDWMINNSPGYLETPYWNNVYIGNNYNFDDFYDTSYSQQQNLSVSGGDEKSNYRVSIGYVEDVGPVKPVYDGKKQYNIRANYNFSVNEWLDIETSTSYFNRLLDGPTYAGNRAFHELPLFPKVNTYGQWGANFGASGGAINRLAELVDGGRTTKLREEFRTKLSAKVKILPELSFRADMAIDRSWQREQSYKLEVDTYAWNGDLAAASINNGADYIKEVANEDKHETYQGVFNYKKDFGDHSFSAMAGTTAEKRTSDKLRVKRSGFEDYDVYDINMGSEDILVETSGGGTNWGFVSLISRLNYNYKDKYMLELQGRRDGSSRFAEGHQWKTFGGGSAGWVISEEDFLQGNNVLSYLKLKASYGELGNIGSIGNHDYASLVDKENTVVLGQTSMAQYTTATANDITSNERTWETIKSTNVGIEYSLFMGKLSGSADMYKMINDQMLIKLTYPDVLGGDLRVQIVEH